MTDIGLRERKKADTRRAITAAALALAVEHGPESITVEDIAAAADVSPRTVFNHFGTKDEAILGIADETRAEIVREVELRPEAESPVEAIATVLTNMVTTNDRSGASWQVRAELVNQHPHLRAAQVRSQAALEHELAAVVAARTGLDAERDAYPQLVATLTMTAIRVALARAGDAGPRTLRREIENALGQLATGLRPPTPRRGR